MVHPQLRIVRDNTPLAATLTAVYPAVAAFSQNGVLATKRIYGNRGNSFIAAVEFGPRIVAKTSLAGGVSGDP